MTFSILARDPKTGIIGGAAATGSYCVGGWVLRGKWGAGMSASQGASPSIYWGEDILASFEQKMNVAKAVDFLVKKDCGHAYRQVSALDMHGNAACFTGQKNTKICTEIIFNNGVALGNMLASETVITAMVERFQQQDLFAKRLLNSLEAGAEKGGDFRGLKSAALLIFYPDQPPLNLRIDYNEKPLDALRHLYEVATSGDYASWLPNVPNPFDKERFPQ